MSEGALSPTAGAGSYFVRRVWLELVAATEHSCVPAMFAADRGQALLAMTHARRHSRWTARVLKSLTSYYTPLYGPLVAAGAPRDVLADVVRHIAAQHRWDIVDLEPLDPECQSFGLLEEAFRANGYLIQHYFRFANWYLRVGSRSFDAYYRGLPSTLRNTLKRKTRGLARAHAVRTGILNGGEAGLDKAIAAYEAVYAASWKEPEPDPTFIPRLIRLAAEEGTLRLGVLYVDEQPAAAQLWLTTRGEASIYKLAHDERYAEWSVGSQLMLEMMRHAIDVDRVDEVDFLMGDEPYKRDWMSDRRERWGIMAFDPRRPLGLLAAMRHIGGRALRKMFAR